MLLRKKASIKFKHKISKVKCIFKQLYVIGGDGTHYGMQKIQAECVRLGLKVGVAGLPKTIDNDIPIIDKSFGFETSVEV